MSFQQIGAFYVLMFGGGGMEDGECDPHPWQRPDTANINLSFEIQWARPDSANINFCGQLVG